MRKIIHIFLSLVIVYAGTVSAYANTSIGGWSAVDVITAGATNTINAAKTAGGKALKSAVTIAPSAAKVGKHLIKGGGAAALAFAAVELTDGAIDWVLDPANNAIRYTVPSVPAEGEIPPPAGKGWVITGVDDGRYFASNIAAAQYSCANYNGDYSQFDRLDGQTVYCKNSAGESRYAGTVNLAKKSDDKPLIGSDSPTEKSIPIDTVAAKVISNAEAGHAPSQEAVKATALEGFAAGEHDAALDAGAVESDAGTENPPDTTNPDNPDAPAEPAPFDPAGIIAAIAALKALLVGILSSITGLSDFFNDTPPEKTKQETDVPVEAPPDVKNPNEFDVDYIGFSSQCPTLSPFSVGIGGASSTMTFDMTPLCNLAVTIRPAIIAIAYFIGLGVVASAIRET